MFDPVPPQERRCRVLYLSPLKALAVDVEKNLREPLRGIALAAARMDVEVHLPEIALRTGDTPSRERAAFQRKPTDFLITTPESLFLMLTSQVRDRLRGIECVIVDEIHSMVGTRRGSHLALSLERLAEIVDAPFQRIGLSATQRPLDRVARFLGGIQDYPQMTQMDADGDKEEIGGESDSESASLPVPYPLDLHSPHLRPSASCGSSFRRVAIVDAGRGKRLETRVMMPASEIASEPVRERSEGAAEPMERDPPADPGADPRPSVDAHLRQQPAAGGAARRR